MQTQKTNSKERGPVVVVMGHIDHGKSTLLSAIRKSNKPLNEAGGITQHISAYEVEHESGGKKHSITFLDTPGHEAFGGIRKRGAGVSDIAILVVSAEDGVKPQTLDALSKIKESKTPYIVAINKIDKPGANIDKTRQNLAEHEIYVEGYGGDIPVVNLSAKTGEGIPELLDMIILVAELEGLTGDKSALGEGIVIESNRDIKKGISTVCVIKNGHIEKGMFLASGVCITPVRIMENYLGKNISEAFCSSPVKIIGWDNLPNVGDSFHTFKTKKEAESFVEKEKENKNKAKGVTKEAESENIIPLVVKADTGSSLEAVTAQIKKLGNEKIKAQVISSSIGNVSETDVRLADGNVKAIVVAFHTKVEGLAKDLADRNGIEIKVFDIIYKLSEWLTEHLKEKTPKQKVVESVGRAKVLKVFSKVKDKQILGGKVEKGSIILGAQVKILRRGEEICEGKVKELQEQKRSSKEVSEGKEFGTLIEAKMEIIPGDVVESFIIVEK